jgi:hypothetical protein
MPSMPPSALIKEVRFARDSPVEGDGFEPSVPFAKKPRFRLITRASKDGQSTCRGHLAGEHRSRAWHAFPI